MKPPTDAVPRGGVQEVWLRAILRHVIARHAFDAGYLPLNAAIDRLLFPVGKRGLRKQAGLHRHVLLGHDFLATGRLRNRVDGLRDRGAERVAHQSDDGDLHCVWHPGGGRRAAVLRRIIDRRAIRQCDTIHKNGRRIAERYAGGETMAELAREYDCAEATVWRALQAGPEARSAR